MNDTKFTKGEWKSGGCAVFVEGGDYLADLVSGVANSRRNPDETEANSYLIASAPELYSALLSLTRELKSVSNSKKKWLDPDLEAMADMVLKKARGE